MLERCWVEPRNHTPLARRNFRNSQVFTSAALTKFLTHNPKRPLSLETKWQSWERNGFVRKLVKYFQVIWSKIFLKDKTLILRLSNTHLLKEVLKCQENDQTTKIGQDIAGDKHMHSSDPLARCKIENQTVLKTTQLSIHNHITKCNDWSKVWYHRYSHVSVREHPKAFLYYIFFCINLKPNLKLYQPILQN